MEGLEESAPSQYRLVLVLFSFLKLPHTKRRYWEQKVDKISLTLALVFVVVVARVGRRGNGHV